MFWIRYQSRDDSGQLVDVEVQLAPGPMEVSYPDARNYKTLSTQDGATIIQRPLRDDRPRKWVWRGYGPHHEPYATQWALLASLDVRTRRAANLAPTVGIWENVSGAGGFARTNQDGTRLYTLVRIVQADRQPGTSGGPLAYDSTLTFQLDDVGYSAF